ncbi:MAG: hypothetical protein PHD04_01130 [Candidatus Pacebacteria bacterium]|nr:hypothetical protein [Candidatus Paceibacterota bacterium]
MKILSLTVVLAVVAAILFLQFAGIPPAHVASTLPLQKDFWIAGTAGINTPDRGAMFTCLRSYARSDLVMVTDCRGHVFRALEVKNGIVDFDMEAPMTVVVQQNWWTGKLSVHPKVAV